MHSTDRVARHQMLDAVITAGGDPARDADLLSSAGGAAVKAMIPLQGKTFLEHVTSALLGTGRVRRVVVVGLPSAHRMDLGPAVTYLDDRGGLIANAAGGVDHLVSLGDCSERIVLASSDIPLVTPDIVSELIGQCLPIDADLCYSIVRQEVMERTFPGSGRSFVSLVDGRFAGGDLCLLKPSILQVRRDVLNELTGHRKTFWKQVRVVGLGTLLRLLTRRLTISQLERRCQRVLGVLGRAVICPHAEVAMDVDKPHHFEIVRRALAE